MIDLKKKRQQLLSFLLRHGRIFPGGKNWTKMHERWLAKQTFPGTRCGAAPLRRPAIIEHDGC
jgi:hypothetical protein